MLSEVLGFYKWLTWEAVQGNSHAQTLEPDSEGLNLASALRAMWAGKIP